MLILKIKAIKLCRLFFKWTAGVSTVLNPSWLFFVGIYIYIFFFCLCFSEQYVLEARYFGGSCNTARLLFRSLWNIPRV